MQAEFYRTSNFKQFLGGNILRLLRAQKKQSLSESTQCTFFRKRIGFEKRKQGFEVPFEQAYGFRGNHPAFYHLSAWEFTQWWSCERLGPPSTDVRTEWTEAGKEYRALHAGNRQAEAPRAGEHYTVKQCMDLVIPSNRRPLQTISDICSWSGVRDNTYYTRIPFTES